MYHVANPFWCLHWCFSFVKHLSSCSLEKMEGFPPFSPCPFLVCCIHAHPRLSLPHNGTEVHHCNREYVHCIYTVTSLAVHTPPPPNHCTCTHHRVQACLTRTACLQTLIPSLSLLILTTSSPSLLRHPHPQLSPSRSLSVQSSSHSHIHSPLPFNHKQSTSLSPYNPHTQSPSPSHLPCWNLECCH